METVAGGCVCGAVRFEVEDVFDAGYCHCSICRHFSAGPAIIWANAPSESFSVTRGTPLAYASSENHERYFCATCGTQLFGRSRVASKDETEYTWFSMMALDTPEVLRPTVHSWTSSRLSYFDTTDELPRFETGTLSHPRERVSWRSG